MDTRDSGGNTFVLFSFILLLVMDSLSFPSKIITKGLVHHFIPVVFKSQVNTMDFLYGVNEISVEKIGYDGIITFFTLKILLIFIYMAIGSFFFKGIRSSVQSSFLAGLLTVFSLTGYALLASYARYLFHLSNGFSIQDVLLEATAVLLAVFLSGLIRLVKLKKQHDALLELSEVD